MLASLRSLFFVLVTALIILPGCTDSLEEKLSETNLILNNISDQLNSIKGDVASVKSDISSMESDISSIKSDVSFIEIDVRYK